MAHIFHLDFLWSFNGPEPAEIYHYADGEIIAKAIGPGSTLTLEAAETFFLELDKYVEAIRLTDGPIEEGPIDKIFRTRFTDRPDRIKCLMKLDDDLLYEVVFEEGVMTGTEHGDVTLSWYTFLYCVRTQKIFYNMCMGRYLRSTV